jgi:hypothetical protein
MKFLMNAQNVLNMNNGSLHTPLEYHKGGDGGAGEARAREDARQLKIDNGIKAVNALFGTTDKNNQYADHRQNVYDLNKTAIDDSYGDAQRNLTFSLARNGLSNSSIGADKKSDLLTNYNDNIQKANDMADSGMNSLKTNDERTRQNLVNSVQTGLDQTQAVSQALGNMQLNYDKANETNVANNWDSMFDNWKAYKRNDQYSNAMGETADGQFGQTYFT